MSLANERNADAGFKPNGRPQSTIALDFSAALDDLFKLNGIGALEESVEQKKETVTSQRYQLHDLESKLREADAKLKTLEAKHRRIQSQQILSHRKPVVAPTFSSSDNETEEDSGDSDVQQRWSPQQYRGEEKR